MPFPRPLPLRAVRRAATAAATVLCGLLVVGCLPAAAPLTSSPVVLSSPAATFVGDGYQHGPTGSATADVVRDGARPAVLPDGTTLQVFADTTSMPGAVPWYFMTSSATLSPAGAPTETAEAVRDGHPMTLLPWTAAEAAARTDASYIGVWPTGAAWIPASVAGGNQVAITYQRVRVDIAGAATTYTVLDQGLATYPFVSRTDALANGIVATRVKEDLLPGANDVVMGAPVYDGGWVYLFGCGASVTCFGARARPAQLADATTWSWFDGSSYAGTRAQRKPLAGVGEFTAPAVQWVPSVRAYAMTSSRGDATVAIRWSSTPAGPWTSAQLLDLPGCGRSLSTGGCFGAVVRSESTTTALVLTYASTQDYRTRVASVAVTAAA